MHSDGSPDTKGKKVQSIPMNSVLTETLLKLRIRKVGGYVFSDSQGQPFGDIKKGFKAAVRRAGIEDLRFHDLRHTFASHLAMSGESMKVLQELLGHSSLEVTNEVRAFVAGAYAGGSGEAVLRCRETVARWTPE